MPRIAFLWLLTGSLLRNETGRVLRMYDSSFIAIRRQMSETGELEDKLKDNLQSILEGQLNSILKQVGKGDNYHVNLIIESAEVDYEFDDE